MIPESAGATPYGIFLLADDYLRAARLAAADGRISTKGPIRLLGYHSAELFLKTYLRSAGETVNAIRSHGHDLAGLLERAAALGFITPPQIAAQAMKMKRKNDYVRVRYVVTEDSSDISAESVIRFAETIRDSVIGCLNLDDSGVPKGNAWLGDLPPDYPTKDAGRMPEKHSK